MLEASKLADAIAASEEHMEELKARITARQDWITREQQSVDAKIEEATRPVASQRTEAAEQHSSLQEEVEDLRYSSHWCLVQKARAAFCIPYMSRCSELVTHVCRTSCANVQQRHCSP